MYPGREANSVWQGCNPFEIGRLKEKKEKKFNNFFVIVFSLFIFMYSRKNVFK